MCANSFRFELLPLSGNVWSAVAHIITGVIGAGVLSLAWSVAQLGWIAGPLCILLFAATTFISTYLLSDCYRFHDPEHGSIRCSSYMDAVKLYLGWSNINVNMLMVSMFIFEYIFNFVAKIVGLCQPILRYRRYFEMIFEIAKS